MKKHDLPKLVIDRTTILCLVPEISLLGATDIPAGVMDPRETYLCHPPCKRS